jgi:CRISPR-associated exonuclease Cas4
MDEQRPAELPPISVPISALEHYAYCPRQAALIHVEQYFESNLETVRGDLAHAAVDRGGATYDRRGNAWHSLPVWDDHLGVHGVCDTVLMQAEGPVPVEHKSGAYRPGGPADLQVAAQVLCLRTMFDAPVPHGIVFTGKDRRRHIVPVDAATEAAVAAAVHAVRALIAAGDIPPAVAGPRCRRCSLRDGCGPDAPTTAGALFLARPDGPMP